MHIKVYFKCKELNTENTNACLLQQKDKSREFISARLFSSIKPIFPGIYHIKTHTTETTII